MPPKKTAKKSARTKKSTTKKTENPWIKHVKDTQKSLACTFTEALKRAKLTYKK